MNQIKKIRGFNRRIKEINRWRTNNLILDIDLLKERQYEYVKFWISPWDNLRYKERNYIGPKSKARTLILNSLLDIYDNWEQQLVELGIPYYLKIWLYEPRLTSSQIVCGINDKISHYENVFTKSDKKIISPSKKYEAIDERLEKYAWTVALDEEIVENDFWPKEQYISEADYYADQKLFRQLEKKQIRKEDLSNSDEKLIRYYVTKGYIWIGNKK